MSQQLYNDTNINKQQKSSKQETRKNKLKENSNKKLDNIFIIIKFIFPNRT